MESRRTGMNIFAIDICPIRSAQQLHNKLNKGMNMSNMVFLDLEETIIRSWTDPTIINLEFIKSALAKLMVQEVHIFSFAIFNDVDKAHFEKHLKEPLETVLEVKIVSWSSVEEIMKEIINFNNVQFETWEIASIWGKTRAFHDFCQSKFKNCNCFLLDDVVPNSTLMIPDKDLVIKTIKVPIQL